MARVRPQQSGRFANESDRIRPYRSRSDPAGTGHQSWGGSEVMKSTSSSRTHAPFFVTRLRQASATQRRPSPRSSTASEPVTGLAERAFAEGEHLLGPDTEHEGFAT